MAFWDMAIYCVFLEAKMDNLGPIDFLLGLLLNDNINVNYGQTNFSKNMVIIANFHLKIGQDATFAPT